MDVIIKRLRDTDEGKWDGYVFKKNENSTFCHQIGWKKAIKETYNFQDQYLYAENETGNVVGILPLFVVQDLFFRKRIISVPFGPYGGVCSENRDVEIALNNYTKNLFSDIQAKYWESRFFSDNHYIDEFSCSSNNSTFILDTTASINQLWDNLDRKVRNMIRKGEKNNLQFETGSDLNDIADFYDIYSQNMKNLGTPVHSELFFKKIHHFFPGNVIIAKVKKHEENIASLFLIKFKNSLISGWGASLVEYHNLAPNDFMYWNCIKFSANQQLSSFDFGRSLAGSNNFRFKKRWGSKQIPLQYCYYPKTKRVPLLQNQYGHFSKIWKGLPLPITKMLGPVFRRYVV